MSIRPNYFGAHLRIYRIYLPQYKIKASSPLLRIGLHLGFRSLRLLPLLRAVVPNLEDLVRGQVRVASGSRAQATVSR